MTLLTGSVDRVSVLDMNEGYHQLKLDESSRHLTTFYGTTKKFRYKRLNFGAISSQDIFDKAMDDTIDGLEGVLHIRDDFVVFVRGELQKRTSGKAYGVIFTDMVMRAVHIEAVFAYDTSSFLLALSRFASVRGWPEKIYSDPGSQLIGAGRELEEAWKNMDRQSLQKSGTKNGSTWIFGPADSPWYQGAVESLVKSAKRAIHFAVNNQRLSVPEFLSLCYEVSNLMNERPIGAQPSIDSTLNILTPNSLLLGRARAIYPLGWQPHNSNIRTRYHLVQAVTEDFWKRWTELYAPTLIVRRKWHTSTYNLRPGDVVIVANKNVFRGEYRLGLVEEVFPSGDGKVRRVSVTYKNYRVGEDVRMMSRDREHMLVSCNGAKMAILLKRSKPTNAS
ncbi:hypothetical protein QZH41_005866 [Actinostola sp. cb2023]|nr:hypothetical protein QZH41_005866 [Actinostola sp. cb2023]